MRDRGARRAFTLIQTLVVVAVAGIGLALLAVSSTRTRCGNRQLKDSMQIRGIHQGMTIWVAGNSDTYPRPSSIDVNNATVPQTGAAKDTTANIDSILIHNGFVPPDMFVSPAEANPSITVYDDYQYTAPRAAADPSKALWDPAFSADFTNGGTGHTSYAHLLPAAPREWAATYDADQAVVGNRGPRITAINNGSPALAIPNSTTLLIHGTARNWEGNIAYNDNRIEFETALAGAPTYTDAAGTKRPDFFHFDEPDDPARTNNYLGIFTTAGETPESFTAIWD